MQRGPLKLFFSYAHEDAAVRSELDDHLDLLERQKVVVTWNDRLITPGREWAGSIDENLRTADLILLLISRPFLASEFVREVEIPQALAQHEQGRARLLPVLLEPVDDLPRQAFGKLEVLPAKGLAISQWEDRTRALADTLVRKASQPGSTSIVLSADLNIGDKRSPVLAALRKAGVDLPDSLLRPTLAASGRYADVIGFVPGTPPFELGPSEPNSGVFDHRGALFAPEHLPHYRERGLYDGDDDAARFARWANRIMSDHLPLWVELAT